MRHHDKTNGSTAPHAAVVDGALAHYYKLQWQNPCAPTRFDYDIQGRRVGLGSHAYESVSGNVRTALPDNVFRNRVYNPDLGEIHRIPPHVLQEQVLSVETGWNYFEQVDRTRKTLDKFKNEVVAWRKKLAGRHVVSLTRRLEYIFDDEPELERKQVAPSLDSFSVLLAYLARYPEFKTPSIGFNLDGTFSAIWSGDKKLRVTLDFMSSSSIRWIFVDSRNGIQDAITGAGIVSLDILSGVLDVYGATSWMKA